MITEITEPSILLPKFFGSFFLKKNFFLPFFLYYHHEMSKLNDAAHIVVLLMSTFARFILVGMDWGEGRLRAMMHGVGLGVDIQTVLVVFVICTFLLGVLRLLKGRLRMASALILFLFLAHTLERIAHSPLVG